MPLSEDVLDPKPRKMKVSAKKAPPLFLVQGNDVREAQQVQRSILPVKAGLKVPKRNLKDQVAAYIDQPEGSNPDLLPDSSASGSDYRALRRKYLLLEEESFSLGKELTDVEDEVRALEEEKVGLLDKLVVLEGLVDPVLQS